VLLTQEGKPSSPFFGKAGLLITHDGDPDEDPQGDKTVAASLRTKKRGRRGYWALRGEGRVKLEQEGLKAMRGGPMISTKILPGSLPRRADAKWGTRVGRRHVEDLSSAVMGLRPK